MDVVKIIFEDVDFLNLSEFKQYFVDSKRMVKSLEAGEIKEALAKLIKLEIEKIEKSPLPRFSSSTFLGVKTRLSHIYKEDKALLFYRDFYEAIESYMNEGESFELEITSNDGY